MTAANSSSQAHTATQPNVYTRFARPAKLRTPEEDADDHILGGGDNKAENARLLTDVTRPESIDVGLMRAEIERLSKDAERYQWLRDGGIYILPYEDHGAGPEFDLSDASVDAAMKETP